LGYTFTSAGQVVDTVRGVGGSCDTVRTIRLTVSPSPLVKFSINDSLQCITSNKFEFINQSTIQNGVLAYLWKLGDGTFRNSSNISYSYSNSGTYNVLLLVKTERGCSDSLQKIVKVSPQLPNQKYDTVFSPVGIETQLFSRKLENAKYKWLPNQFLNQDDIYNPIFKGDTSQLYIIRITDITECIVNDTLNVICNIKADIIVPKAFSPNNDKINDELKPLLVNIKKLNYFRVYNRWGVKIYDSANDSLNKWDGRFKTVNQPVDTYVWVASGIDTLGNVVTRTGNFILLR
jgi:gliding motility-associated-like protein